MLHYKITLDFDKSVTEISKQIREVISTKKGIELIFITQHLLNQINNSNETQFIKESYKYIIDRYLEGEIND